MPMTKKVMPAILPEGRERERERETISVNSYIVSTKISFNLRTDNPLHGLCMCTSDLFHQTGVITCALLVCVLISFVNKWFQEITCSLLAMYVTVLLLKVNKHNKGHE